MRKISSLAYVLFAAIAFAGCSGTGDIPVPAGTNVDGIPGGNPGPGPGGNPGGGSGNLDGTYEFVNVSLTAKTETSTSSFGMTVKTVSDVEYTSTDNTGTVVIDGNKISSTNFSYSIEATMKTQMYSNGVPLPGSGTEVPFVYDMPSSNSEGTFKYVGTNEIQYLEGGFIEIPSTGQQLPSTPNTSKYEVKNGELILTAVINETQNIVEQGQTWTVKQTGVATTRLKKK
ncbi:hypothetical protein [Chitinophaga sp.]|uniref:hypothetical protein n=1 Tax=Chitinophaga sp. TaxID=1869181 RepID=UPI00262B4BE6|nr:hypothetical protein [uncultured Chitinophaga sp.]